MTAVIAANAANALICHAKNINNIIIQAHNK
jgi:hypothetical protein